MVVNGRLELDGAWRVGGRLEDAEGQGNHCLARLEAVRRPGAILHLDLDLAALPDNAPGGHAEIDGHQRRIALSYEGSYEVVVALYQAKRPVTMTGGGALLAH